MYAVAICPAAGQFKIDEGTVQPGGGGLEYKKGGDARREF